MPTFEELRGGYAAQWSRMKILPEREATLTATARRLLANRERYQRVSDKTNGIPWFFIAVLHDRESSGDFDTHLHNGDPLTARTRRVPAGRPAKGSPPFTWEESAIDALTMKGFHLIKDWSVERMAFSGEGYNGFGYRNRGVPSAYLWSFSDMYRGGKFVADRVWSASAIDKQAGIMPLMRMLANLDASVAKALGSKTGVPTRPLPSSDFATDLLAAMRRRGDPIAVGEGELNPYFVRGMGLDHRPNGNPFDNRFNDLCGVLRVSADGRASIVKEWPCTIDPGKKYVFDRINDAGAAAIAPGYYRAWTVGFHPMSRPNHEALVQNAGDVTVYSDDNEDGSTEGDETRTGRFGINIHGPGTGYGDRLLTDIGPVSAGCLVVPSMPMQRERMAVYKSDARYLKNKNFVFGASIFDAKDIVPTNRPMDPAVPVVIGGGLSAAVAAWFSSYPFTALGVAIVVTAIIAGAVSWWVHRK